MIHCSEFPNHSEPFCRKHSLSTTELDGSPKARPEEVGIGHGTPAVCFCSQGFWDAGFPFYPVRSMENLAHMNARRLPRHVIEVSELQPYHFISCS